MNRRTFIYSIFSASISATALGNITLQQGHPKWKYYFPEFNVQDVIKILRRNSRFIYVIGPSVLFLNSPVIPRVDFLISTKNWKLLKEQLYNLGVNTLPLLSRDTSMIEFEYKNTIYFIKNQENSDACKKEYLTTLISSKAKYAHEVLIYDYRERTLFDPNNVLEIKECTLVGAKNQYNKNINFADMLSGIYDSYYHNLKLSQSFLKELSYVLSSSICNENPVYISLLFLTCIDDILDNYDSLSSMFFNSPYINTAFQAWSGHSIRKIVTNISNIYEQIKVPFKESMFMLLVLTYLEENNWRGDKHRILFSLKRHEMECVPTSILKITRAYELSLQLNIRGLIS